MAPRWREDGTGTVHGSAAATDDTRESTRWLALSAAFERCEIALALVCLLDLIDVVGHMIWRLICSEQASLAVCLLGVLFALLVCPHLTLFHRAYCIVAQPTLSRGTTASPAPFVCPSLYRPSERVLDANVWRTSNIRQQPILQFAVSNASPPPTKQTGLSQASKRLSKFPTSKQHNTQQANMMRKFLVVCVALVALFAVEQTQAACKVKSEVGSEANSTTNKIQAAPTKRLTNKLLFDVVTKKTDTSDEDDDAEENTDDDE